MNMQVKIKFLESCLWGEIHSVYFFVILFIFSLEKNLTCIKRRENTTCCYLKEQFIQDYYYSINIEEYDLYELFHMTKNNILYYIY